MGADRSLNNIVLFDGVCNLCSASVQFALKRNLRKNLKFASLQSAFGQKMLDQFQLPTEARTMVLIKNNKAFLRSDAALELTRELNALYPALYIFKIIPRFIRDAVYNFISQNRYRWFGKKNECWIPSSEFSDRFTSE